LVRLCAVAGLVVLSGSYLGALHPLGDSLAVFRVGIAVVLGGTGVVAVLFRQWATGAVALSAAAAALVHVASFSPFHSPPVPSDPDIIVYSKNLAAGRVDWVALGVDIESSGADVVVLQEVTQATAEALPVLLPDHPHQHICNFAGWGAMAVASRWPLSQAGCTRQRSLAHAVVDAPGGSVWVASVHQVWPYPHGQAVLLPDILAAVEAVSGRMVIAGDFNMVPWGNSVRRIARAGGLCRIGPVESTREVRNVGLSIDHVLTDGWGTTDLRARLRSDHFGLVAWIAWEQP